MMKKSVYFETYGCPSNKYDQAVMVACLEGSEYAIVDDPQDADIFVINTCGVKKTTEDRILSRLRRLHRLGKPVVVAGCLPRIDAHAIEDALPGYLAMLDPLSIDRIAVALQGLECGVRTRRFFSNEKKVKTEMPTYRRDSVFAIVPISEGCLGACTFCCTRFARGRLFSYPVQSIVDHVKKLVADGVVDIWLTAQDVGAYGLDRDRDLVDLLEAICAINGNFCLRVGMMNPHHVLRILDRLVGAYRDRKVFKFLHLPVQSGNDEVLQRMNRPYTVGDFEKIVDTFREGIPALTLSTDVICGFPTEDAGAFEDTCHLISKVAPDVVNITKFSPRPRTIAAAMKQLPSQTVKARSRRMTALCKTVSLMRNQRWVHWEGDILLEERGKGSSMVGRNFAYKPVVLDGGADRLGERTRVTVIGATATYLMGEPN